jgi:hypothetical protein
MDIYGGEHIDGLTPKRLFPMTGLNMYISLINSDGKEVAIIRNMETLMPESREAVDQCLNEYYMMPKIKQILSCWDKFGILKFEVLTDRGTVTFDIKNRHYDIKKIYGNRILMRDRNDNRYEIEDYTLLDKKSIKLLYQYI